MASCQQSKYYQTMMDQFHEFFAENLFLDTTIRLGKARTIYCNRLALGAASPSLRQLLLVEKNQQEEEEGENRVGEQLVILVPESDGREADLLHGLLTFAARDREEEVDGEMTAALLGTLLLSHPLEDWNFSAHLHEVDTLEKPGQEEEGAVEEREQTSVVREPPGDGGGSGGMETEPLMLAAELSSAAAVVVNPLFLAPQPPQPLPSSTVLVDRAPPPPVVYPFACAQCGTSFVTERQLLNHHSARCTPFGVTETSLVVATSTTPLPYLGKYACSLCDLLLANKSSLELHMRSAHAGYRPFSCHQCTKSFTSAAYLRQHSVFHAADKAYECDMCGKRYQNANSLHQHRRDTHLSTSSSSGGAVGGKMSCPDCGKLFAALRYLTEHRARKHNANFRRPACVVCGKTFAGRTELATHATVHTGERPFRCERCGKTFRLRGVLRMHARTHDGNDERSAVCDVCGKRFLQASDLNKHKLAAHSGEKPFACAVCGRAFARRDYLRGHMKVHQQLPTEEETAVVAAAIAADIVLESGFSVVSRRPFRPRRRIGGRRCKNNNSLGAGGGAIRREENTTSAQEEEEEDGMGSNGAAYTPPNMDHQSSSSSSNSLMLEDVGPMTLRSIVEGSETLLVVTNLDSSATKEEELVIEEFKPDRVLADDSSAFL